MENILIFQLKSVVENSKAYENIMQTQKIDCAYITDTLKTVFKSCLRKRGYL